MKLYCIVFSLFFCIVSTAINAQTSSSKNTLNLAHERIGKLEEFHKTQNQQFKVKLYSIDKPISNKKQHWFLQILDKNNNDVNYGKIQINAYLKSNNTIKLNYIAPAFAMCNQGKYVIGFVKAQNAGIWVLDITIENNDTKDVISLEMNVESDVK
jgi:hypothetical protein